jgi:hypothetical protein
VALHVRPGQHEPEHVWFIVRHATHDPPEQTWPDEQPQSPLHVEQFSVPLHTPSPHRGTGLHTGFAEPPQVSPALHRAL